MDHVWSKTQLFFERPQAGLRFAKVCRGLSAFGGFFVAALALAACSQDFEQLGAAMRFGFAGSGCPATVEPLLGFDQEGHEQAGEQGDGEVAGAQGDEAEGGG